MTRWLAPLILTLGSAIAAFSASRIEALGGERASGRQLLYLPSGRFLKAITFGYEGIAADLIYLWSIQYTSNREIPDRYDSLDHIYRRVIAELDPHYVDPYLVGSMIMSVEANRPDLALRLLDTGIARNPGIWILPFEAGFLSYHRLGDYSRARDYFEKVLAIPGAPPAARRLHAEMFNRLGDRRSSLRYWSEILETADTDYVRRVSWLHVHDLRIEVDLEDLRNALALYRERRGNPPPTLGALVHDGYLASLPSDPEGRPYLYRARDGEVSCASRTLMENR